MQFINIILFCKMTKKFIRLNEKTHQSLKIYTVKNNFRRMDEFYEIIRCSDHYEIKNDKGHTVIIK